MGKRNWGDERSLNSVIMRENLCLHLIQYFLEHVNSGGRSYGNRKHIPVFHDSHRKCRSSPLRIAYGTRIHVCFLLTVQRVARLEAYEPAKKRHHSHNDSWDCFCLRDSECLYEILAVSPHECRSSVHH